MKMTRLLRLAFWLVILGSLVVAVRGRAQDARAQQTVKAESNYAELLGVWNAEMDGLPAATVVLTDEGGSLSGAILFYLHRREAPDKPYTASAGLPEPMFNMKFDGEELTFEVSHRRAHQPRTLNDPPVKLRLKLLGNDASGRMQAEVSNLSERSPAAIAVKSE